MPLSSLTMRPPPESPGHDVSLRMLAIMMVDDGGDDDHDDDHDHDHDGNGHDHKHLA